MSCISSQTPIPIRQHSEGQMLRVYAAGYVTGEEPQNKEERQTLSSLWNGSKFSPRREETLLPLNSSQGGDVPYLYYTSQEKNLASDLKVDTISFPRMFVMQTPLLRNMDHTVICNIHKGIVSQHRVSPVSLIFRYVSSFILPVLSHFLLTPCTFALSFH